MSRFGLLAGTVAEGVDPTTTTWGLSGLGWSLVLMPYAVLALGYGYALIHHQPQRGLVSDMLA
jgi:hypothetical protein